MFVNQLIVGAGTRVDRALAGLAGLEGRWLDAYRILRVRDLHIFTEGECADLAGPGREDDSCS